MQHYGIDVNAERRSTLPIWDIEYESKFIYNETDDTLYYGSDVGWVTASGGSPLGHIHDDRYYTESEVDNLITTISGKLDDHNELNNLDYASAGHTGFQQAGDYLTETEINTISGSLSAEIDSDISTHSSDTTSIHGITDTSDLALKSGNVSQFSDITSAGADIEAAVDGITPYVIATGETVSVDDDEQLIVVEEYQIDGTGSLEVDGNGTLSVIGGPKVTEGLLSSVVTLIDYTATTSAISGVIDLYSQSSGAVSKNVYAVLVKVWGEDSAADDLIGFDLRSEASIEDGVSINTQVNDVRVSQQGWVKCSNGTIYFYHRGSGASALTINIAIIGVQM